MKLAALRAPTFDPGTRWRYSNTGYLLLGAIIRRVSGMFYGDLLGQRLFRPLGMRSARVISEADIVPNRSAGYRLVRGQIKNQEWVAPSLNTTADGALYLSIRDLIAWDRGLTDGRVLTARSRTLMWTPAKLVQGGSVDYGFGWLGDSADSSTFTAVRGFTTTLLDDVRREAVRLADSSTSSTFHGCDNLARLNLERHGAVVARSCYVDFAQRDGPALGTFWLTAQGAVADFSLFYH